MRALVLSIRDQEYVEAARITGSSDWRIMLKHNYVRPLIGQHPLNEILLPDNKNGDQHSKHDADRRLIY